jgi:hypothetical protein
MDNRRQLPRWEIKKEATVWLSQLQGFNHCIVEDMNLAGMRVSFNRRLPHQQVLRMSFSIGDNFDFIKIDAGIAWVKEERGRYVYGLSISKMDEDDKAKMYQYISVYCEDQFTSNRWGGVIS